MCPGPCGWVTVKLSAAPAAVVGTPRTPPIWMVHGHVRLEGRSRHARVERPAGGDSGINSGPLKGCAAAEVARLSVRASTKSITRVRIEPMEASLCGGGSARALADAGARILAETSPRSPLVSAANI